MFFVFKGEIIFILIVLEISIDMIINVIIVMLIEVDVIIDDVMFSFMIIELLNFIEVEIILGKICLIFKNNCFKFGEWFLRY